MGGKIVKIIFKKCKDPCSGLLEYNTPITGMYYSPCQLIMSRLRQYTTSKQQHIKTCNTKQCQK